MLKRATLPLLLAALAGCTWVTPSPEAMQANIKVVDQGNQPWGLYRCEGTPAATGATPAPAATSGLKTLPYTPPR